MTTPAAGATGTDFAAFDRYVDDHLDAWTQELVEYLAIPSEGGRIDALREAAEWTADRFRRLGAAVEVLEANGAPPLVVGEIGDGPRTVTGVQHYDVQPAVPLELWTTPPYEPDVRDGRVWARGATDNKGELMPRLWAVEAWLATIGPLPCRVRYLVEGQEETGSGALDAMLDLRPHLREAHAALIEGGGLDMRGRPSVVAGGKGIIVVDLDLRTMAKDSHSSVALLLPNAAQRMIAALATFWDADGLPAIHNLDIGAKPPTEAQRAVIRGMNVRELDDLLEDEEIDAFLGGVQGFDAFERMTFRPTLNVQGLWSGHTEETPKTIIPAEAHARLDIRIVPDQQPELVVEALRRHLDQHGFGDIVVNPREGEPAWWTAPDHPVVLAAGLAAEAVTGQEPSYGVSMPGTVPMFQVCSRFRVPATSLGAARDDCDAHAPNENIRIEDLATATRITARFLDRFAALPDVPPVD